MNIVHRVMNMGHNFDGLAACWRLQIVVKTGVALMNLAGQPRSKKTAASHDMGLEPATCRAPAAKPAPCRSVNVADMT